MYLFQASTRATVVLVGSETLGKKLVHMLSDGFGSLGMQHMMLVSAHRYTDSVLSSDYVLTNVPLAAE